MHKCSSVKTQIYSESLNIFPSVQFCLISFEYEYGMWPFPSNILNLIPFVTYLANLDYTSLTALEYLGTVIRHKRDIFLRDQSFIFRVKYLRRNTK